MVRQSNSSSGLVPDGGFGGGDGDSDDRSIFMRDVNDLELPRTDLQHNIDQLLQTDDEEQRKRGALYVLKLKEICGLSESAVGHVVKETQKVFCHSVGRIKAGVNERLSRSTLSQDESLTMDVNCFFDNVKDPFDGIHSTFLQESYYREHFGCLVCF